ncbi:MAG: NYN domain-containing protein, partial [archaeon]|nr:NYN domain-containing protein [archaeon]
MIFIDGSNLYHSLKRNFNTAKIDFEKFGMHLIGKDDLITIFYYTAPVHQNDDPVAYQSQQKFLANLAKVKRMKIFFGRLE